MPAVGAAIGAAFTSISGAIAGNAILGGIIKAVASMALSKLAQRLLQRRVKQPGQQIDAMTTGETASETFVVGRFATGGHLVYHGSHGKVGKTPNAYYTRVLEVAGMPGHNLRGVILGGEYVSLDGVSSETGPLNDPLFTLPVQTNDPAAGSEADYGFATTNDSFIYKDRAHLWLKFYDGTQSAADAMLLDRYGSDPTHPFSSDMIGDGIAYAIVTYRFSREVWKGEIEPRFVVDGIPLLDPRTGQTVWTANPAVIAYNVARGIVLPSGDVYGGGYADADLPLARWVAAMNICDEFVSASRPRRYEFGAEIAVNETEPAELIEACMTACGGQIAAIGGQLIPQVGAPDVPVWSVSDDDISADDPLLFEPIKGLADRYNATRATYLAPAHLWEARNLPLATNPAWEAEDGGRRLVADLRLAGVYSAGQASELAEIYIKDERRQRVHQITLPPDAARVQVFDTILLTRPQDGYQNKLVEIVGLDQRTDDLFCTLTVREVDPDDYNWTPGQDALNPGLIGVSPVVVRQPFGFAVSPAIIRDNDGEPRRAGLRLSWDTDRAEDVDLIRYEIRRVGETDLDVSGIAPVDPGEVIVPLLPATTYEARAEFVMAARTQFTDWLLGVTPTVLFGQKDWDFVEFDNSFQIAAEAAFRKRDEILTRVRGDIRASNDLLKKVANQDADLSSLGFLDTRNVRDELTLEIDDARAQFVEDISLAVGEIEAVAGRVTTIESALDTPETGIVARIDTVELTRVTAGQAIAAVTTEISADYGSLSALAEAAAFAEATADGIVEGFVWRTGAGGLLELVSVASGTDGPVTTARIRGDYIRLDGNVQVMGTFQVGTNNYADASINAVHISNGAVTAGKIAAQSVRADRIDVLDFRAAGLAIFDGTLQSSNFVTGAAGAGWRIQNDGSAEFGTLALRENAVSVLRGVMGSNVVLPTSFTNIATLTFAPTMNAPIAVWLSGLFFGRTDDGQSGTVEVEVRWRGSIVSGTDNVALESFQSSSRNNYAVCFVIDNPGATSGTLQFRARRQGDWSFGTGANVNSPTILCTELKR